MTRLKIYKLKKTKIKFNQIKTKLKKIKNFKNLLIIMVELNCISVIYKKNNKSSDFL